MAKVSIRFLSVGEYFKLTALLTTCSVFALILLRVQTFVPVELLTRDPAEIANHSSIYGIVSNVGAQLWTATAAICFMGVGLLHILQTSREKKLFLLVFGCFSTILGLDDLFMLHERLIPNKLGIAEEFVLVVYVVAFFLSCFRFRKQILRTQSLLFLLSVGLFTLSVGFDTIIPTGSLSKTDVYWIEDGAKFLGILLWLLYFTQEFFRSVLLSINSLIKR